MKKTGYDMLYLCKCGINGTIPDIEKDIDLEKLYNMCQFHSLTALVCYALESCGISDAKFLDIKAKAIRKNILLESEQQKICNFMEQNGIKNMALKGAILKDLYPKIGMRQMADNDILYDEKYQQQLAEFMKENNYSVKNLGKGNHDIFIKQPVYNFEMHTSLFGVNHEKKFHQYYINIWDRLIKVEGKSYSYHFTDEDFYIYMIAHEYKHYDTGGMGIRSVVDCIVYLKSKPNLDFSYIETELKKLGIDKFEKDIRNIVLNDNSKDNEIIEHLIFSGTYGTIKNATENSIKKYFKTTGKNSKLSYIMSRLFPNMDFYKNNYPFFYHYKILLPFCWLFRLFRMIFTNSKNIVQEIKIIKKYKQ